VGQNVYRAPKLPEPIEPPPSELVYVAIDHEKGGIHVAWIQVVVLPIVLGIVVAVVSGIPWAGLVTIVGAALFAYRFRKSSVGRLGATLRVAEGELRVSKRSTRTPFATIKLRDLTDVRLDTTTIERVQEGDSMVAAVRFTDTRVGPKVDQARIVLVGRKTKKNPERLRIELTDEYFAYMEATEWLGKIRVFLRKNGWVPADERKKDKNVRPLDEDAEATDE
jgi:hypothetical protein